MDYELAKKLKDAGFPQREWGDLFSCESGHELLMIPQKLRPSIMGINIGETISCPTLEELIEACGKDFDSLFSNFSSLTDGYNNPTWRADATNRTGISVTGLTPSEAVAHLYLEINKK